MIATRIIGACIVGSALLDPTRILMMALGVKKLRQANPDMFDGAIALPHIIICVNEYQEAS